MVMCSSCSVTVIAGIGMF